jgi:membrane fusion protein
MSAQNANAPFFRHEVIAADNLASKGAIRLSQPLSASIMTSAAMILLIIFISYVCVGSVSRKAQVTGVTVSIGGNAGVYASAGGLIVRSLVKEGDEVKQGEPLFELSNEQRIATGVVSNLMDRQLYSRKASLIRERQLSLLASEDRQLSMEKKIKNLQATVAQAKEELAVAVRRAGLARAALSKYQTLSTNGFISDLQLQQKEAEMLEARARLGTLKRDILQLQESLDEAKVEKQLLVKTGGIEQAQIDANLANLEQEITQNDQKKSTFVTAPSSGRVAALICQHGQVVSAGQTLALLSPPGKGFNLEAQLYAPSRAAGLIRSGQTVSIRYHAFPYEKFGIARGTVIAISDAPLSPSELPPSLASTILTYAAKDSSGYVGAEGLYRIEVSLEQQEIFAYGKLQRIRPGMTLEADVIQERRKIWEWLVEPLLAVTHVTRQN